MGEGRGPRPTQVDHFAEDVDTPINNLLENTLPNQSLGRCFLSGVNGIALASAGVVAVQCKFEPSAGHLAAVR